MIRDIPGSRSRGQKGTGSGSAKLVLVPVGYRYLLCPASESIVSIRKGTGTRTNPSLQYLLLFRCLENQSIRRTDNPVNTGTAHTGTEVPGTYRLLICRVITYTGTVASITSQFTNHTVMVMSQVYETYESY
jgi:hypothetical protein